MSSYNYDLNDDLWPRRRAPRRVFPKRSVPVDGAVFYIIWNPSYESPPRVRFTSLDAAQAAAESMAARFPQHVFYVCKATSVARAKFVAPKVSTMTLAKARGKGARP